MAQKEKIKINKEEPLTSEVLRTLIKSAVSKMGPKYTIEEKKEMGRLLVKIFEKGMSPYEAMDISEAKISELYVLAYGLFNTGKYEEAAEVFKMLTMLVPTEPSFPVCLGVCFHKRKQYRAAISCYMMGAILDKNDPVPFFYCYDSFLNLNDLFSAGVMISNAVVRCGDYPKYAKLKERGLAFLNGFEEQFAKTNK